MCLSICEQAAADVGGTGKVDNLVLRYQLQVDKIADSGTFGLLYTVADPIGGVRLVG